MTAGKTADTEERLRGRPVNGHLTRQVSASKGESGNGRSAHSIRPTDGGSIPPSSTTTFRKTMSEDDQPSLDQPFLPAQAQISGRTQVTEQTQITEQIRTTEQIHGLITKVYRGASATWSAGKLETLQGDQISFAGKLHAEKGASVSLSGYWQDNPPYGKQFQVTGTVIDLSLDADGLINYLANDPDIKGIGPKRAESIVRKLGKNFEPLLIEKPADFAEQSGIPKSAVENLRKKWLHNKEVLAVTTYLSKFDLTHYQVTTLVEKFGNECLAILQDNPYALIREVRGFGFKRVDEIAMKTGTSIQHPKRLQAGLEFQVESELKEGHCHTEKSSLLENTAMMLSTSTNHIQANDIQINDIPITESLEKALDALLEKNILAAKEYQEQTFIGLSEILTRETDLADWLVSGSKTLKLSRELSHATERKKGGLNTDQYRALLTALQHRVSLITGPAGSGKTHVISILNGLCRQVGKEVALAAPTGKAARRISEVCGGAEAQTIHRLLKYDGIHFEHNRSKPLKVDLVIVDEVSMVDINLAWQLFDAIDLSRTSVVLVGDHNQLPSVGPGSVLRDILACRDTSGTTTLPTVELIQTVRQAGTLKENCFKILEGKVADTSNTQDTSKHSTKHSTNNATNNSTNNTANNTATTWPWIKKDNLTNTGEIKNYLLKLLSDKLEEINFNVLEDVQVLTPQHKGPLGTKTLNHEIQRLIQKKFWGIQLDPASETTPHRLLKHDKVIQTRNNYDLGKNGVMNGTIGQVTDIASGKITVRFNDEDIYVKQNSSDYHDLQLAYALTIHKVQGSEFPCAILVVSSQHTYMHHRNLLYTGVTRAKQTAIILGDKVGINRCAYRQKQNKRRTFLSQLLSESAQFPRNKSSTHRIL